MPTATAIIRRAGSAMRFELPYDTNKFLDAIVQRIGSVQQTVQEAFEAEFKRQIKNKVVPELVRRTPVRTGRLRRSTKYAETRQGYAAIQGRFYGAFLNPSQRTIAREIFNNNKASIYAACANAARRAVS